MKFKTFLYFLFSSFYVSAQTDNSIWNTIKQVEANEYVFSVPEKWKKIPQVDASSRDEKFEFTDVGLPRLVNDAPLTAFFVLTKMEADSIDQAVGFLVNEFKSYPDRITQAGEDYLIDSFTIASGERAYFISTRFYRRSKVSNFSLYELAVYSEKRNMAFLLTITYRYKDPTYMAEANLKLKDYALRVFKSLELR